MHEGKRGLKALPCLLLDFLICTRFLVAELIAWLCHDLETFISELIVERIEHLIVLFCQTSSRCDIHEEDAFGVFI